jgi:hypothetical protein
MLERCPACGKPFGIAEAAPEARGGYWIMHVHESCDRGAANRAAPFLRQDVLIESGLPNLLRADLHCLHAGFCFGLRFEGAIVHNGGGRCGRLGVHDGALLGGGIAHNVILGRARRLGDERGCDNKSSGDIVFIQGFLLVQIVMQKIKLLQNIKVPNFTYAGSCPCGAESLLAEQVSGHRIIREVGKGPDPHSFATAPRLALCAVQRSAVWASPPLSRF